MTAEKAQLSLSRAHIINPFESAARATRLKMAEISIGMIDYQDPNGFIDEFYFLNQNAVGIAISNHRSHADFGVVVETARRMNKPGNFHKELMLPLARSISAGKQSRNIRNFYEAQTNWLKTQHVKAVEVVRDADVDKYGMAKSLDATRALVGNAKPNHAYYIFPEAHVTGGRTNPETGLTNGMIKPDNNLLQAVTKTAIKNGTRVIYLPIGIEGTENIFDNTEGARELPFNALANLPATALGVGRKLARAVVGVPFSSDEMFASGVSLENSDQINSFALDRVARLVSAQARGSYRINF